MNPFVRGLIKLGVLVGVLVALFLLFPRTLAFVEEGARELRYFWWLILLVALGVWLVWGVRRKPK